MFSQLKKSNKAHITILKNGFTSYAFQTKNDSEAEKIVKAKKDFPYAYAESNINSNEVNKNEEQIMYKSETKGRTSENSGKASKTHQGEMKIYGNMIGMDNIDETTGPLKVDDDVLKKGTPVQNPKLEEIYVYKGNLNSEPNQLGDKITKNK